MQAKHFILFSCGEERILQYFHNWLKNYASYYQVVHTYQCYCIESVVYVTTDLFVISVRVFHEGCAVKLPIYCVHFQHLIKEINIKVRGIINS